MEKSRQDEQQQEQFSLNDLLQLAVLALVIVVILLAYKAIALAHQKNLLQLRSQKGTSVCSSEVDSSSEE